MTHRNDQIGSNAVAVTPSDTTMVNFVSLEVGVAGDVAVQHVIGTTVVYKNRAAGSQLVSAPIVRVMATSTTATDIVGVNP